jgi:hypothetical protein
LSLCECMYVWLKIQIVIVWNKDIAPFLDNFVLKQQILLEFVTAAGVELSKRIIINLDPVHFWMSHIWKRMYLNIMYSSFMDFWMCKTNRLN